MTQYIPEQYETIAGWWSAHNWQSVPEVALSKTGLVISDDDGTLRAAGWLYRTDSPVMLLEWVVANPDNTPRQSYAAIKELLDGVKLIVHSSGGYLLTFLQNEGLLKTFIKQGFSPEEKPCTIVHYGG
jgi:hypothetical protein